MSQKKKTIEKEREQNPRMAILLFVKAANEWKKKDL